MSEWGTRQKAQRETLHEVRRVTLEVLLVVTANNFLAKKKEKQKEHKPKKSYALSYLLSASARHTRCSVAGRYPALRCVYLVP